MFEKIDLSFVSIWQSDSWFLYNFILRCCWQAWQFWCGLEVLWMILQNFTNTTHPITTVTKTPEDILLAVITGVILQVTEEVNEMSTIVINLVSFQDIILNNPSDSRGDFPTLALAATGENPFLSSLAMKFLMMPEMIEDTTKFLLLITEELGRLSKHR